MGEEDFFEKKCPQKRLPIVYNQVSIFGAQPAENGVFGA